MENFKIKGFSFAYGARLGDLKNEKAKESLQILRSTGTEWIALCVEQLVDTKRSLEIRYNYNRNVTDIELIEFIKYAKSIGMKICLKPMINVREGNWRAEINFYDDLGSWAKWFYEYTGYLTHMAEIAEYTGCEMICLGCEMLGTERQEGHWRTLIKKVREIYSGALTYNTNHGHEFDANWYDELDYVGTSAYFRMHKAGNNAEISNPYEPIMDLTREDMLESWREVLERMEKLHEKCGKKIIFMEIGCRSARGCACQPWDFRMQHLPYDEEEQALFYDTCMEVFENKEFFMGFFWWDWYVHITKEHLGNKNTGFGIYGKKAQQVLEKYYKR